MSNNQEIKNLFKRLEKYPKILERIKTMIDIMEDKHGNCELLDDAEGALIPETSGIGKDLLECWSKKKAEEKKIASEKNGLKKHCKKNSCYIQATEILD